MLLIVSIYSLSFAFDIFAVPADKRWGTSSSNCSTDEKTGQRTCCWREPVPGQILGKTYCQTCDRDGKVCKEKVLQFIVPPLSEESVLPEYGVLEQPSSTSDSSVFPKNDGLLGLLDNPTIQPDDNSNLSPKNKGLLGLLDGSNPTIQQPLPETVPQKDTDARTDLLSNLNDNNLITNDDKTTVPKEDSEPFNLLEQEQQESPITETDSDNGNILKDEDKEETEEEEEQPSSQEQLEEEQQEIITNQKDEIQSEEPEEELNEEQQEPPLAETFNPNVDLIK